MINSLRVCTAVAYVSFREILRDKILYNVLVIAVLLLSLGFLASRLTYISPDRVILDFGISAVNLSLCAIAVLVGSSMLNREVERRTMFLALSRPISRFDFVLGKFLGICGVLCLNWLVVSGVFIGVFSFSGGSASHAFGWTLLQGLFLLLLQSFMMSAVAIFFSSFSTTSLSSVLAVGIYLIGNNISQILMLAQKLQSPVGRVALKTVSFVIPNLEYFNLGLKVTYGLPVPTQLILVAVLYASVVSSITVGLAGLIVRFKEV